MVTKFVHIIKINDSQNLGLLREGESRSLITWLCMSDFEHPDVMIVICVVAQIYLKKKRTVDTSMFFL